MDTIKPEQLKDALQFRYATKVFDSEKKIPEAEMTALTDSLVLTPSSFGLQPWRFILVESSDLREALRGASWGQSQVVDASHLIVFTTRTDLDSEDINVWMKRMAEVQRTAEEDLEGLSQVITSFVDGMSTSVRSSWNSKQAYIALGQLMVSAALIGIDACPLEGISTPDYDRILGLEKSGYATDMACALGYRSAEDKYAAMPKARFPAEKVIVRI